MAEGVSREAVITCGEMTAFERRSGEDGLAKISVGVEEPNETFDLNVIELAGEVRNGIVPADQAVRDHVETSLHLFGDDITGDIVLYVEEVGGGAVASVESGDRSPQDLQPGGVADPRVAARAGKVEAGRGAHWETLPGADSRCGGGKFTEARKPARLKAAATEA